VRGIRDAQARAGITPTNHSRHNITAVKEQSRLNALKKLQDQEDAAGAPSAAKQRRAAAAAAARAGPAGEGHCRVGWRGSSSSRAGVGPLCVMGWWHV
jgi:hypothetical protein